MSYTFKHLPCVLDALWNQHMGVNSTMSKMHKQAVFMYVNHYELKIIDSLL